MQFNPQEFAQFMEMWQAYKTFQEMMQPQPNPVQVAQPQMVNQQEVMAQSNAAATGSVQEIADLKAQIEKLKAQLSQSQEQVRSLTNELRNSESQRINAVNENKKIGEELFNLKKNINLVEAYEGEEFKDKIERIEEMSGQDYYDNVVSNETNLTNTEKHDLIEAFENDRKATPIVDFETGQVIQPVSQVAKFWAEQQEKQKGRKPAITEQTASDRKFEGFGKTGFDSFL
jgi:uncharacterized coiled-coil protein SlyX